MICCISYAAHPHARAEQISAELQENLPLVATETPQLIQAQEFIPPPIEVTYSFP